MNKKFETEISIGRKNREILVQKNFGSKNVWVKFLYKVNATPMRVVLTIECNLDGEYCHKGIFANIFLNIFVNIFVNIIVSIFVNIFLNIFVNLFVKTFANIF